MVDSTYEHHVEQLELAWNLAEVKYKAFDEIALWTQQVDCLMTITELF